MQRVNITNMQAEQLEQVSRLHPSVVPMPIARLDGLSDPFNLWRC